MMVQKDLNGHLDRVNLLIQLTHGQGPPPRVTLSELFLRILGSPQWTIFATCFRPTKEMLSFLAVEISLNTNRTTAGLR
jgi:hypothetical protein